MSTPIILDESPNSCDGIRDDRDEDHATSTPLILDVSPATYADIRDQLRQHGHRENVGNKLIHLNDIPLREREPNREGLGILFFVAFFAGFTAFLVWAVTHMWAN